MVLLLMHFYCSLVVSLPPVLRGTMYRFTQHFSSEVHKQILRRRSGLAEIGMLWIGEALFEYRSALRISYVPRGNHSR